MSYAVREVFDLPEAQLGPNIYWAVRSEDPTISRSFELPVARSARLTSVKGRDLGVIRPHPTRLLWGTCKLGRSLWEHRPRTKQGLPPRPQAF